MSRAVSSTFGAAAGAPATLTEYDRFLSRLAARDRLNVERHVAACGAEASADHLKLWKRLACTLAGLAPHSIQSAGQHALQFFIPDGKYRMQVFAMEDLRSGRVMLYTKDVLETALHVGLLTGPDWTDGQMHPYTIVGHEPESLEIEWLTAANAPDAPEFYRHMLGWNRKALRITLPTSATPAQAEAAEDLCELAARQWMHS